MKILYIGAKYDYADPDRGFSLGYYNFYDTLVRMDNGKHQVSFFPSDEITISHGKEKMNKMLIEAVNEKKPDLCFFFLRADEIKKETIREISDKKGITTLNWFADDHWRFDNFSKYWAPCFSWVVTTDCKSLKKYDRIGYGNVILSQWAYNHFFPKPLDRGKIYDIVFIGQPHGKRKKMIERIKRAGIDIKCWGYGWPRGRISQKEMIRIYCQSKIGLNSPNSSTRTVLNSIGGIFFQKKDKSLKLISPYYWIDNIKSLIEKNKRTQLKQSNFEIPGCGTLLLAGSSNDFKDYYKDGQEVIIYKNTNELIEKIKYYLKHDGDRETIARAGYELTLKEHTYEKRFQQIFKKIAESPLS